MTHMVEVSLQSRISCNADIGEGPVYDAITETLFWVDIPRGNLWSYNIASKCVAWREVGEPLGSVALIEGGGWLLATRSGIRVLPHWSDHPVLWCELEPDRPTQCNDGKCDSRGRFLVGTAAPDGSCSGALYRIDTDGSVHRLVSDIGMSNGLDWSPDDRYFYHVDTLAQTVFRYDWDAEAGIPHNPVPFINIPQQIGMPDGLTVDCDGCLWLAIWGAGAVQSYDPDGHLLKQLQLPTPNTTSCAFGGTALNELYITTAAVGVSPGANHVAGDVFQIETKSSGQRRPRFPRHGLPIELTEAEGDA